MHSKSSWFDGMWFSENILPKKPITTTTHRPLTTAPSSWFQTLLDTEENDGAYISNDITISKNNSCLINLDVYLINIKRQLTNCIAVI